MPHRHLNLVKTTTEHYELELQVALTLPTGISTVDAINYLMDLRKHAMVKMGKIVDDMVEQVRESEHIPPEVERPQASARIV
jgi:hypothetical protein